MGVSQFKGSRKFKFRNDRTDLLNAPNILSFGKNLRDVHEAIIVGSEESGRRRFKACWDPMPPVAGAYDNKVLEIATSWKTLKLGSRMAYGGGYSLSKDRCEELENALRGGTYMPGNLSRRSKRKPNGKIRHYTTALPDDKAVEKGVHLTISHYVDPAFPLTVLARNGLDALGGLCFLKMRYEASRKHFLAVADIKEAFRNVDHKILASILSDYVPKQLTSLIMLLVSRPGHVRATGLRGGMGLNEGCSLSSLLFNIFRFHFLERPLRCRYGTNKHDPFSYTDNLFELSEIEEDGIEKLLLWDSRLKRCGLILHKEPPKTKVFDLTKERGECLGYEITIHGGNMRFYLPGDFEIEFAKKLHDFKWRYYNTPKKIREPLPDAINKEVAACLQYYGAAEDGGSMLPKICSIVNQEFPRSYTLKTAQSTWEKCVSHWEKVQRELEGLI